MTDAQVEAVAKAICREQCAFYGEAPCWQTGDWPNAGCDEPGCIALAKAAISAAKDDTP